MALRFFSLLSFSSLANLCRGFAICCLVALFIASTCAKEAPLSAVELYKDASGPGYVLITGVLVNGKNEVRGCGSGPKIDKSTYGKLPKIILSSGMAIEYGDGGLTLTADKTSSCVVPSNLKFEKNAPMTPAEMADRAKLEATVLPIAGGGSASPVPLKPGVKIIFVSAPSAELGEYLLADRESAIGLWQGYLSKYPTDFHSAQAKQSLVSLLVADGDKSLEIYRASLKASSRSYEDLKHAQLRGEEAVAVIPGDADGAKLIDEVQTEIAGLLAEGHSDLQDYKQALAEHTAGYVHIVAAVGLAETCVDVDPHSPPALAFRLEAKHEADLLEVALHSAGSLMESKRFDDAFAAIAAYKSFTGEVPRLAAVVDAAYQFHFDRAAKMGSTEDWEGAIEEYQKASEIKPTKEVAAALNDAGNAWEAQKNKRAADAARERSATFGQGKDYVDAYEVLAKLPPKQRELVANDMHELEPMYIQAAPQAAKGIEKAHEPIRGLADEVEVERAYGYLERAYELSGDASLKDRLDDVGDKLSEYYLTEGKRYLEKPLGTGAGLAWSYLDKALRYKASNLDAVRDQKTIGLAAYQMRSTLSIRVVFRDQTSRRDSTGFAEQLNDSIATGLETSGLRVKVIRQNEAPAFEPNFELVGDVLEHSHTTVPTSTPKESHFSAGEQPVPNDEWNKANREHEAASLELQTAQQSLQGAITRGKKKEITQARTAVDAAQKKVEDASVKLDAIPKSLSTPIIRSYTYTEKHVDYSAVVSLRFRIVDFSKNPVVSMITVDQKDHQDYTIPMNVKPDDTDGVKEQGTVPDETQFLTNLENSARDELIKKVKESVAKLPAEILEQARKKVQDADIAGAAEFYTLYLNSTPVAKTPERQEAEKFLLDNFNIKGASNASS